MFQNPHDNHKLIYIFFLSSNNIYKIMGQYCIAQTPQTPWHQLQHILTTLNQQYKVVRSQQQKIKNTYKNKRALYDMKISLAFEQGQRIQQLIAIVQKSQKVLSQMARGSKVLYKGNDCFEQIKEIIPIYNILIKKLEQLSKIENQQDKSKNMQYQQAFWLKAQKMIDKFLKIQKQNSFSKQFQSIESFQKFQDSILKKINSMDFFVLMKENKNGRQNNEQRDKESEFCENVIKECLINIKKVFNISEKISLQKLLQKIINQIKEFQVKLSMMDKYLEQSQCFKFYEHGQKIQNKNEKPLSFFENDEQIETQLKSQREQMDKIFEKTKNYFFYMALELKKLQVQKQKYPQKLSQCIYKYKNELQKREEIIEKYQSQIKELNDEKQSLKHNLEEMKISNENYFEKLKKQVESFKKQNSDLLKKINEKVKSDDEKEVLLNKITQLENKNSQFEIQRTQSAKFQYQKQETLEKMKNEHTLKIEEQLSQIKQKLQIIKDLYATEKIECQRLKRQNGKLKQQISQKNQEYQKLKQSLKQNKQLQNNEQSKKIESQKVNEMQNDKVKQNDLQKRIGNLQSTLNERNQEMLSLLEKKA